MVSISMAKSKFKCACGTTTRLTGKDAMKTMEKPKVKKPKKKGT